jgi:hypothetical protein
LGLFPPKATVEIEGKNFKEMYNGDGWEPHTATCIVFDLDVLDVCFEKPKCDNAVVSIMV